MRPNLVTMGMSLFSARTRLCSLRHLSSSPTVCDDVLFKVEKGNVGIITLNRPKVLNAFDLSMATKVLKQLTEWSKAGSGIQLIMIEGNSEKAFCAGGDIQAMDRDRNTPGLPAFLSTEYSVYNRIGTLHIPYISLNHGITMGAGAALSVHGKYRVGSEKTMYAMPENKIGLFPDVGGGHFLPTLRHHLGFFLGITGHVLKGVDVLHAGVVNHGCELKSFPQLKSDLTDAASGGTEEIERVLETYTRKFKAQQPEFSLKEHLSNIDFCFSASSMEEMLQRLQSTGAWGEEQIKIIEGLCPTSVALSLEQLKRGAKAKSLAEVLIMEYRLIVKRSHSPDFVEGVRALLKDKDNKPKWNPPTLEQVTSDQIEDLFSPLPDGDLILK